MRTFRLDKLVRDKYVDRMESEGCEVRWRQLNDDEFDAQLRLKIAEEMAEARASQYDSDEVIDVFEAMDTLQSLGIGLSDPVHQESDQFSIELEERGPIDIDQLEAEQQAKRLKTGGFILRIFVETVALPIGNPFIEYYTAKGFTEIL